MTVHVSHSRPRVAIFATWFVRLVLLWFLWTLILLSDTGNSFFLGAALSLSWYIVLFVWVGSGLLLLEHRLRLGRVAVPGRIGLAYLAILGFMLLVSVLEYTHGAVLIRVKLSEPALQTLVQQTNVHVNRQGTRVGLFRIMRAEQRDSVVWLVTQECGWGDECGLVYSPDGKPPYIDEDYYGHLDGPWWIWLRSW